MHFTGIVAHFDEVLDHCADGKDFYKFKKVESEETSTHLRLPRLKESEAGRRQQQLTCGKRVRRGEEKETAKIHIRFDFLGFKIKH